MEINHNCCSKQNRPHGCILGVDVTAANPGADRKPVKRGSALGEDGVLSCSPGTLSRYPPALMVSEVSKMVAQI